MYLKLCIMLAAINEYVLFYVFTVSKVLFCARLEASA
jgi:hypothetical protein